jgi:hypothetical protein
MLIVWRALTKGHDSCVPVPPVPMLNVVLDKGQDVRHHVILATRGHQHQAHASSFARVPLVIVIILFLQHKMSTM